jgi:hypothetical protein
MATTYTPIAAVTVGSGGAATIDFTSIPQTYTDLQIMVSVRKATTGSTDLGIRYNSSTSGYYYRQLKGNGATASSNNATNSSYYYIEDTVPGSDYTANTFNNSTIYIPDYTGNKNKSAFSDAVSENNATTAFAVLSAGLWYVTSAITDISIKAGTGNFAQYSTATLYGIKKN